MAVRRVRVAEGERHSTDDDISKNLKIAVALTSRAGICHSASSRLAVSMRVRLKKGGAILPILGHCIYVLHCYRVLPFGRLHSFCKVKVWPTW